MAIVECGIGCGLCIYVCPTNVIYSASVGMNLKISISTKTVVYAVGNVLQNAL